jgi:hypothetical protein
LSRAANGIVPGASPKTTNSRMQVPIAASRALSRSSGTVKKQHGPESRRRWAISSTVKLGLTGATMPPTVATAWKAMANSIELGARTAKTSPLR